MLESFLRNPNHSWLLKNLNQDWLPVTNDACLGSQLAYYKCGSNLLLSSSPHQVLQSVPVCRRRNPADHSVPAPLLRPDFKLKLLSTDGTYESRVADVKTVSCGAPSWYKVGERAVERRAAVVPGEYAAKARAMDSELDVDGQNVQGPASRRLQELGEVIPLVFGGFAEVSEGVHEFVNVLARQRLKKEGLASGVRSSDNRLGVVVGQIRRRLSLATWKANTNCLLSRTTLCGDGASEAGKRRQWQRLEEEKMRREKEAVWRARVSGHHIVRRGRFLLD